MTWRMKRAIGTAVACLVPLLVAMFAAWSVDFSSMPTPARVAIGIASVFLGGATFTYPGWSWED